MEVYDYRQELIDLLNNTADNPQSLLQTQRSLTTILNILNHYQENKTVKQNAPRFCFIEFYFRSGSKTR